VRRELWENRSIYIAPLAVAAVVLFGFLLSTIHLPDRRREVMALDPIRRAGEIAQAYDFVAIAVMLVSVVVAAAYCLGALHNERRDRSILFWKSLPVSDLTTVLSKATIPMVVAPLVTFAVIVAMQLIMLTVTTLVLLANSMGDTLWAGPPFIQMTGVLAYGLVALALWYAPIYGWLLLVSVWAKRATFLWAVLPPIGLCIVEKIAFDSSNFASLIGNRLTGFAADAFDFNAPGTAIDPLKVLDPGKYLSSPGLWVGLVVAVAFLAAAVWLRRRRDPI
jgi:ABC-2 type transport system permease protein